MILHTYNTKSHVTDEEAILQVPYTTLLPAECIASLENKL